MLLSGKAEDMNQLSFITETYTEKMEGRIDTVNVISQEKWRNPEKVYMYKLRIRRQKENVCSYLYRSFTEFQEFHWKLCYRFSSRAIPALSMSSNIGRTNVRTVAMKRQLQLEGFLQALFRLSDEVAHSDLVYTFFHTLYRDSEPEIARAQELKSSIRHDINSPPQLHLRLSLDETRSEFRVFVGHAKQLPLVGTEKSPDSYVKTYLRQLHSPQQKHYKRKTLVVKSATNPTYNAELIYSLGNISVQEFTYMILEVSVWHSGTAVLKDNFQLCEALIPLSCFQNTISDRKGVKLVEKWYSLALSLG